MAAASQHKITDAHRQQIRDLHADGLGRNQIAQQVGLSVGSITKVARELGLAFDRSKTAVAVAARQLDLADRRTRRQLELNDDIDRLRARLFRSMTYVQYGGKDFERAEDTFDQPTPVDQKHLVQAIGTLIDRDLKLADHGKSDGVDDAKAMLGALMTQLRVAVQADEPAGAA